MSSTGAKNRMILKLTEKVSGRLRTFIPNKYEIKNQFCFVSQINREQLGAKAFSILTVHI